MRTGYSYRYTAVGGLFLALALALLFQLVRLQVIPDKDAFIKKEQAFLENIQIIEPARGLIYDRSGHILAANTTVYEVGVDLQTVQNPETIALTASVELGLDYYEVFGLVSQPPSNTARYVVIDNFVPYEKAMKLEELKSAFADATQVQRSSNGKPHSLVGLELRGHLIRSYPEDELAYNILGFVNLEGVGAYGVESRYNDMLSGQPEYVRVSNDPSRATVLPAIPDGASLILTIDREIQAMVESVLRTAVENSGAEAGSILVMQPETGEMLAMASYPQINPNEYWDVLDAYDDDTFYNMAISPYEPGSVFKAITMAAALDLGVVESDTVFIDTGYIMVGGIPIYNWDGGAWGPQTMLGCMQHSLNVCLAHVASEVGAADFYAAVEKFGFGRPTGIELAGEYPGRVRQPGDDNWYMSDLATNSFGQGISVTPIQMITALSALANDGQMVVPHIVQAVVDRGQQYPTTYQVAATPISAETARTITEMLAVSLEQEASVALVPGYRVAGKTGTAEIPTPYGYTSDLTNASFAGWGPVDDPQFLVYIWLQKPTISPWGSVVAAPVFKQVVERLVVLMDLPPDDLRQAMAMP